MSVNLIYKEYKSSSEVWKHFLRAENGSTAKCKLCPAIIKISARSTKGLHTHLRTKHNMNLNLVDSVSSNVENPAPGMGTSSASQSGSFSSTASRLDESASSSATSVSQKRKKLTDYFPLEKKVSMEERVCRMIAKDGIPFAKFITSIDLRELFESEGHRLPSSASTIQTMLMAYGASIRKKTFDELEALKKLEKRFTLTFDEWTSLRNRRYLNLNLHLFTGGAANIWNLGLARIEGRFPAEACVTALEKKLQDFKIDLNLDVIAVTTDGAAVMKKVGRLLSAHHQLCFAHGLQLAVLEVLYNKRQEQEEEEIQAEVLENRPDNESDNESEDGNDEQGNFLVEEEIQEEELLPQYRELIQKVRKIVKVFSSKSPVKNDLLQKYIKAEFGKELQLILDCRTRWSSLASMLSRFNEVKHCISKALIDLKLTSSSFSFTDEEFMTLTDIELALEPVKLAVNVLCREDATLVTAETTLRFMINKLNRQNTRLSQELVVSLSRRIKERRTSITAVLLYLENPKKYLEKDSRSASMEDDPFFYPRKATLRTEIKCLIERLVSDAQPETENQQVEDNEEDMPLSRLLDEPSPTLEEELERSLRTEWLPESRPAVRAPTRDNSLDLILKREMTLFECGGNRGKYLETVYTYVKSIPPTSVEAERAFSAAGYLCNKIRSNLKDETLDTLSFLRKHFQKK